VIAIAVLVSYLHFVKILNEQVRDSLMKYFSECGQKIASIFSKATIGKYIKRVIGGTFIGAGVSLAVNNR